MPVPVEYNSVRRMSTINVPKQDINFDTYDFQLCVPQNDIKDTFESKDLEASFCRDFACCGLVLNDLHDLLQHYEECHVRLEEDENSLFDDESDACSIADDCSTTSSVVDSLGDLDAIKKKAAAYLSDLYNCTTATSVSPLTPSLHGSQSTSGKKRTYSQYAGSSPSALDLLTQSAAKKIATLNGDLPTPIFTEEDLLAQAGALLASANTIFNVDANADKPYKCPVHGCDKAYKNPNGLKYHNQHGHCNLMEEDSDSILSKPYQCTIGDCGKRYKNLNGLKYHIEHSHMAALNQTLASFSSSLFSNS
ncbi:hypothetical protein BDF20DRAFT_803488, partial [Mycotypha africana]|uniref:uncharacterized protein n=1 Tax=Mycotypha africana TaxID=64632 RepID=UPI002301BB34